MLKNCVLSKPVMQLEECENTGAKYLFITASEKYKYEG